MSDSQAQRALKYPAEVARLLDSYAWPAVSKHWQGTVYPSHSTGDPQPSFEIDQLVQQGWLSEVAAVRRRIGLFTEEDVRQAQQLVFELAKIVARSGFLIQQEPLDSIPTGLTYHEPRFEIRAPEGFNFYGP